MEHKNTHSSNEHHSHHLVPFRVYFNTLIALLILTIVTVGASYLDFGKANIVVSLGIATFKAALVMMFFMGLKYDTNFNRAFILSSFVGLGLLIFFCAADLWTRDPGNLMVVKAQALLISRDDFLKLEEPTPEQLARGKKSFEVNCSSCHGIEGLGNGIAAAALNPKPRNFHAPSSEWKNGNSAKSIYVTLANGIAGGPMASYKALSPLDRWALVHYVRSFNTSPDSTGKADSQFALAMKEDGIGEGNVAKKEPLPIDFAIERLGEGK